MTYNNNANITNTHPKNKAFLTFLAVLTNLAKVKNIGEKLLKPQIIMNLLEKERRHLLSVALISFSKNIIKIFQI